MRPIEKNYRERFGELDIIMRDRDCLVFVEVRYRADNRRGGGLASVTRSKQRRLIRAAQGFLKRHAAYRRLPSRFDVVAVEGPTERPQVHWVRNAFVAYR